ncbi:S8 family peptidase [Bradyrhizobium sp. 17]|uniref:S8 family peptidase n=1 Tax=Bradyrhizobium sp. 17 TaxID=2782649 RepID=UPI001FF9D925|nr:S8 family peptidase [Bradyrhizobium sp. 17]MCK1521996.1 S8 family peptidase [Bradyrhizobium sp. 17]
MPERKSVIVTFKRKDQRPDQEMDKLEILRGALTKGTRSHFLDPATLATGPDRTSINEQVVGYDVNQYEVPIVSAQLSESEIQALRNNGNVAHVEYDAPCRAIGYGPYHHLRYNPRPVTVEAIPEGVQQVKAPLVWAKSKGKGIRVAVLDTGIDFYHPDLKDNYVDGVTFVEGTSTPMDDNEFGHGTHCAGTIAAAENGVGVIGVAPEASLYAVKVLDKNATGLFSWSIAGIAWCIEKNIHIISMSLGSDCVPNALKLMCDYAWSKGLLIVSGAGNQARNPAPPQQSSVDYPAKYRNVIAVSSIDSDEAIAPNSGRGPEVDVCAPGVDILSTIPNNEYGTLSGTSAACPHVSGVAALTWAIHPNSTNEQIWNLIASTVDNLGIRGRDCLYGYGRVNAYAASGALLPPPVIPKRGV